MVVGSQRNVNHSDNTPDKVYSGRLTRVGLDVGMTGGGVIVWAVFATADRYAGMLVISRSASVLTYRSAAPKVRRHVGAGAGELTLQPAH